VADRLPRPLATGVDEASGEDAEAVLFTLPERSREEEGCGCKHMYA
jgi:hypothetical protein